MELGDTFVKIARKHETTQYITAKLSQPRQSIAALMHRDIACKRVMNNDRYGVILCVPRVSCSHIKLFCLNRIRKIRFPFTGARHRQQF